MRLFRPVFTLLALMGGPAAVAGPIEVHVEIVMQYNDSYNDQVLCYTNTIHNPDGGTHLSGFRSAVTRAINQYAKSNEILKEKDPQITGDDAAQTLTPFVLTF